MFKVNNRNIRIRCEICSKLTIETPERRHWPTAGLSQIMGTKYSRMDLVKFVPKVHQHSKLIPKGYQKLRHNAGSQSPAEKIKWDLNLEPGNQ